MKKSIIQIAAGVGLGALVAAATAMILGTSGAWLAIGIVLGVAIGAAMFRRNSVANINEKQMNADR